MNQLLNIQGNPHTTIQAHADQDISIDCVLHVSVPGAIQTVQPLAHSDQSETTTSSAGRVGQSDQRKWKICLISAFWMKCILQVLHFIPFHNIAMFLYLLIIFILTLEKTADQNWMMRVQHERCRATFLDYLAACQQTRYLSSWKSFLVFRSFCFVFSLENVH